MCLCSGVYGIVYISGGQVIEAHAHSAEHRQARNVPKTSITRNILEIFSAISRRVRPLFGRIKMAAYQIRLPAKINTNRKLRTHSHVYVAVVRYTQTSCMSRRVERAA